MGLVWLSTSWTSRTVEGPRSHRTPRISSSASVGRNWDDFRMTASYYEVIRSVNENLRSQTLTGPAGGVLRRGSRGRLSCRGRSCLLWEQLLHTPERMPSG